MYVCTRIAPAVRGSTAAATIWVLACVVIATKAVAHGNNLHQWPHLEFVAQRQAPRIWVRLLRPKTMCVYRKLRELVCTECMAPSCMCVCVHMRCTYAETKQVQIFAHAHTYTKPHTHTHTHTHTPVVHAIRCYSRCSPECVSFIMINFLRFCYDLFTLDMHMIEITHMY